MPTTSRSGSTTSGSVPTPRRLRRRATALLVGVASTASILTVAPAPAGANGLPITTGLVSRAADRKAATKPSSDPALSGNARFVAFTSEADDLVPDDGNGVSDVFVKDRWSQSIERVSVADDEAEATGESNTASISDDGRYVAFRSTAPNLIDGDDKGLADVFVRDRVAGKTIRVVTGLGGTLLDRDVVDVSISGNGRYVGFATQATNVVSGDTNDDYDVFVRDLVSGVVERVSLTPFETQGQGNSGNVTLSDDGRYVAFESSALLVGGTIGATNVYVRDRTGGTTILANVNSAEEVSDFGAGSAMISGSGRYVAFASKATTLVASDTNGSTDVFRRDLQAGLTVRTSLAADDKQLAGGSSSPVISDNGAFVGFSTSVAAVAGDAGTDSDAFVRNVSAGTTRRVSLSSTRPDPTGFAFGLALDDSGLAAAFQFTAALTGDNALNQVYVNDQPTIGPWYSVDVFIHQQYRDFLGRDETGVEKAGWKDRFERGSATPITLIATLAADPEFSAKRAPVVRLYWAFFLRKPDPSGLSYWIGKFQNGTTLGSIAQKFAQSSEFKTRYGALTNAAYVKQVYVNVFERQPDAGGLAYWTGKLDRKELTRGQVIIGFSESTEGIRRLAPQVYITLIAQGMYQASPTPEFWDHAFAVYKAGEKELAWLAGDTLDSMGYAMRFD